MWNCLHHTFALLALIAIASCDLKSAYDYIIIGAGSSGATVAGRLSENSKVSVLLLEAGGTPSDITEIPLFDLLVAGSPIDWNYTTSIQTGACLGYVGQVCPQTRGKGLGGTSLANYMLYSRGCKKDYDLWAAGGATGWAYHDVLPYFKKAENLTITDLKQVDLKVHGRAGPLTVSSPSFKSPVSDEYLAALKQLGYNITDYNSSPEEGFGKAQNTIRNGARCSTEKAYLRPAYARKNLQIVTGALVTKVVIVKQADGSLRATGVNFEQTKGQNRYVAANLEVILSAGVFNSPQILMLSGVGPEATLKNLGITVLVDLPVGYNFHDHMTTIGAIFQINQTVSFQQYFAKTPELQQQFLKGEGPWTTSGLEALGYIKTKSETVEGDYPNLELLFATLKVVSPLYTPEILAYFNRWSKFDAITIAPISLHTKSRGCVKLNSTDPYDKPIIDYQYFSNDDDLQVVLEGIKISINLTKTAPLAKFNASLIPENLPGCEAFVLYSDDYLKCLIKSLSSVAYHGVGTCKMGSPTDSTTVVDPLLQVKGIQSLRVVDASVMPTVITGHTNAASIMIGEKAADLIKSKN